MTGTAASVYVKMVTTLSFRLRNKVVMTITALVGVAGLMLWSVAVLSIVEADQGPGTLPFAQPAGLPTEITPVISATLAKSPVTSASTTTTLSVPAERDKITNQVTVSTDTMAPEVLYSD